MKLRQLRPSKSQQSRFAELKFSILGTGLVFGDDDILASRPYQATLKCLSQQGEVLVMAKEEFLRIFRSENDSWKAEFNMCMSKERAQQEMMENWQTIQNDQKASTKRPQSQNLCFQSKLDLNTNGSLHPYQDNEPVVMLPSLVRKNQGNIQIISKKIVHRQP